MKILVTVKQVPDTATQVKIAADGKTIDPTGITWIVSPYDEFALEEALRIKEKRGQGEVVAVTLGPDRAKEALRSALARRPTPSISPARLSRPFHPSRISASPSSFSFRVPPGATSVATTSAPARANATEIARPIPWARAHPVTSTVLPSNSPTGMASLFEDRAPHGAGYDWPSSAPRLEDAHRIA